MKFTKAAACAIMAFSFSAGAPNAQSLSSSAAQAPAEFPPASFAGRQYVDSRGCVFIRAGAGSATSWVPRVTRTRELICGQTPSLGKAAVVAAAPKVDTRAPVRAASVQASGDTVARAQSVALAAEPVKDVEKVKTASAAVAQSKVVKPKPVKAAPARVAAPRAGSGRIVPKHVYLERLGERDLKVPKGYAPVWGDDRLNLRRAEQTREGYAKTQLVWTSTVPRRLIDRASGQDVTAKVPLVYPYTDFQKQSREYGKVALVKRNGKLMKRVERAAQAKTRIKPRQTETKVAAKVTKGRYVQVGAFGEATNARAVAQRLKAAGLPARIGKVTRKGKTLQLVVAGPYADHSSAAKALRQAKSRGFPDAFLRK